MPVLNMISKKRSFLPSEFSIKEWSDLEPYYDDLKNRSLMSLNDLKKWLKNRSELESIVAEDLAWRYIKMTCDTANQKHAESYKSFISNIQPEIAPYSNQLDKKLFNCPFKTQLLAGDYSSLQYKILIREIEKNIQIFRKKNIPLLTNIRKEKQQYAAITGAMSVKIVGKEYTLQQAGDFLQDNDRTIRENVFLKINDRRSKDRDKLDKLFNVLIKLRHQVAVNAGFKNFRDYTFVSLGRFDYTPEDCYAFHDSVAEVIVPVLNELAHDRKNKMHVEKLRPWDLQVDKDGSPPLKPFNNTDELIEKTKQCFYRLDPFLGDCLVTMKEMGHLDMESRKGKAPGGYNYPLDEIGVPFIFMNATSTLSDLVTIVHEGGHAVHSFLTKDLELVAFKHTPSEVAELASMSMELISMEHWDLFFDNACPERSEGTDLLRAKRKHLEQIIETLPWVATIDKFQHWIYQNPDHKVDERVKKWNEIFDRFSSGVLDWQGLEHYKNYIWQKQLHLYEVPFYYIEYGIAQLGALAVWKNFKENSKKGLEKYLSALRLGYTMPIRDIYETAGIKFDFSKEYIRELIGFVKEELGKLRF